MRQRDPRNDPSHSPNRTEDPGRTPDSAEGGGDPPTKTTEEPGKTPGQAEGERNPGQSLLDGRAK